MVHRYTFLRLAEETLLCTSAELTSKEIWELATQRSFEKKLTTEGLTPWDTLSARLVIDVRDNPESHFARHPGRPAKYSLRDRSKSSERIKLLNLELQTTAEIPELETEILVEMEEKFSVERVSKYPYRERELHPYLSWFAKFSLGAVLTKTIYHETSSKKNFSEWLHPDLVGFWFPFSDYSPELLSLSGDGLSIARFYSFEMKRSISFSNLRESFFQAVSNSSWAHEGYLAAPNIDESENLREELGRLSGSFGIGVIELDIEDPQQSQILYPAKRKLDLDWEGTNKLARENPDFRNFLKSARIDIVNSKLHESEYDKLMTLIELKEQWNKWNFVLQQKISV